MRRTQLYLDDDLWNALHTRAQLAKTTISELVREAVRERYFGNKEARKKAMLDFIGIRKDRPGAIDSTEYVRQLRRDNRLERLGIKTK